MWIKNLLMCIIGLSAGGAIAGAYVTFIASLGVYTRLEDWANSGRKTLLTENLILAGTTVGNLLTLYDIPVLLGKAGLLVCGVFVRNLYGLSGSRTGGCGEAVPDPVSAYRSAKGTAICDRLCRDRKGSRNLDPVLPVSEPKLSRNGR